MTVAAAPQSAESNRASPAADSFSHSMVLLLIAMVSQRAVGLLRNMLLCGVLDDAELGRWSLMMNYLNWAAPFVVLGIPGSFGRLSESFRQAGQLRVFVARTLGATCGLMVVAFLLHLLLPGVIARTVFNTSTMASLIPALGSLLVLVILFNGLGEFLTSVCRNRVVSRMQLTQSVGFALVSAAILLTTPWREGGVLFAFGAATLAGILVGARQVWRDLKELPPPAAPEPVRAMWSRIATLAFWIWCGNLVGNLLDCSDQILLKHFSGLPSTAVDAMLGQLYASRVLPILIMSVATLTAGCVLPYLIKDWEAGRLDQARERMNTVVKGSAIGFTLVAAATHILNPIVFTWLLRGRYDAGIEMMPWAFAQYSWFGIGIIVTRYLLCVDRPRIGIWAYLAGIATAAPLMVLLVPVAGLTGVAWAMAIAHGVTLAATLAIAKFCGMTWERSTLLAAMLPAGMVLGGWACLGITAALLIGGWESGWLLNTADRRRGAELLDHHLPWWRRLVPVRSAEGLA